MSVTLPHHQAPFHSGLTVVLQEEYPNGMKIIVRYGGEESNEYTKRIQRK